MRFRSEARRRLALALLAGIVLVPLPRLTGAIAQSNQVIIQEGVVQPEDLYAFGSRVIIEGVVDGYLIVGTGELIITGEVTGDVLGFVWDRALIGGRVDGSVRLAGARVETQGIIGDDLAIAVLWGELRGRVDRDVLAFSWDVDVAPEGSVGRDVRGPLRRLDVAGMLDRNVDVTVRELAIRSSAAISGDVIYRSRSSAEISPEAEIEGQVVRRDPSLPIELRVLQRLVTVVVVLGFIFGGLLAAWLFRNTTRRASVAVWRRPLVTLGVGLGAVLLTPLAAVLLVVTLVGIPVAVVLLGLWLVALFFGPVPAVSAVGGRLLGGRGGVVGGFLLGAVLWRGALWLLPFGAGVLYAAALAWGTGGWIVGAWEARRRRSQPIDDLFEAPPPTEPEAPEGWQPPLPPERPVERGDGGPDCEGGEIGPHGEETGGEGRGPGPAAPDGP